MKLTSLKRAFGAGVLTFALAMTSARGDQMHGDVLHGFYVDGNLGANVMQDLSLSFGGIEGKFALNPGVRLSGAFGYMVNPTSNMGLGLEFETGVLFNTMKRTSATVGGVEDSQDVDGEFYQVPFLVNAVVVFHPAPRWSCLAGVGGGGDYCQLHLHAIGGEFVGQTGRETDGAVQAMGGVRYQINPAMEVGLTYKYLAVFARNLGIFVTDVDTIGNHSLMGSFTWHF